jgi:hypothetical protein
VPFWGGLAMWALHYLSSRKWLGLFLFTKNVSILHAQIIRMSGRDYPYKDFPYRDYPHARHSSGRGGGAIQSKNHDSSAGSIVGSLLELIGMIFLLVFKILKVVFRLIKFALRELNGGDPGPDSHSRQ